MQATHQLLSISVLHSIISSM